MKRTIIEEYDKKRRIIKKTIIEEDKNQQVADSPEFREQVVRAIRLQKRVNGGLEIR